MNKYTTMIMSLLFILPASPSLQAGLTTYPDPPNAVDSSVFSMTIDGTPVTVMKYMDYHYAHFAFDGTVSVTVTASQTITSHTISPQSLGLGGSVAGNTLSFSMDQVAGTDETPRYLVITINSLEKLVLLGDPPETDAPPSSGTGVFNVVTQYGADPTGASYAQPAIQNAVNAASSFGTPSKPGIVYVPAGIYNVREDLFLRNNVDLYLAPGAVLKADENVSNYTISSGTIDAVLVVDDAVNVTIRGRGEVDASGVVLMNLLSQTPPVFLEQSTAHPRRRIITTNGGVSSNVEINGIIAKDATGWSIDLVKINGVTVQNVKVLNHKDINWKIQNDGINCTSSSDALINQCFVMTIDDAMCSKARYASMGSMDNVEFANNVLWNWSAGIKCGMQNDHPMNNVVFRNIDIVHCRRAIAFDTKTSLNIPIENIQFRDIRVEEMEGHWSISNHDAVEFLLELAPVNNIGITNFTLPLNRPLRCGPNYPANNVSFHNLVMAGVTITNVSQVTLAGARPINNLTFTIDPPEPSVTLSGPANHDGSTAFAVTATFTEDVTGLTAGDFVVSNGAASGLAGGPAVYTVNITPSTPGPVTVSLPAGAAQDGDSNDSLPSNLLQVTYRDPNVGIVVENSIANHANTISGSSITIGYSMANAASTALAICIYGDSDSFDVSSLSWGGTAADLIINQDRIAVAYFFDPDPAGTAFSGTVTFNGNGNEGYVIYELSGVDTAVAPVTAQNSGGGTLSITTTASDSLILNWYGCNSPSTAQNPDADSVIVKDYDFMVGDTSGGRLSAGTAEAGTAGTYPLGWTPGGSTGGEIALAFAPSITPISTNTYAFWASSKGLTAGLNDGLLDDADVGGGDGVVNLYEYALGGDPLAYDSGDILPTHELAGGYLNYIYKRRTDYLQRGLTYQVLSTVDLADGPMTNETEFAGSSDIGGGFERATNRVSTATEAQQFMDLKVELSE